MTIKSIKFDSRGKPLPDILIGNERIQGSSALAGEAFVVCREHGTSPATWVRKNKPRILYKCCRKCVKEHCVLTWAVERPAYLADGTPVSSSDEGNPNGHSY